MQLVNRIHFRNWRGDLFGGLTAAVIALPMALAFGVATGAGATAGLYGAVLIGLFASLFGGTPALISEPTGPMTVVMTAAIANLVAANPENGLELAFTTVMMAGLLQIGFGLLKLGRYVTLMPYTVISGFMSGIGIILLILQLAPFLGQPAPPGGVIGTLEQLPQILSNINPIETLLAGLTVAIIFFTPNAISRWVPAQLVALLLGTCVPLLFFPNLELRQIQDLGEFSTRLPYLHTPTFRTSQLQMMLTNAAVLAMLGSIDALLTSVVADSLTRTEHDSDKELIGQGIGNLAAGLFGGIPGAGATMGTVVNIQAGGKTILSGLIRALILVIVVLGAGNLMQSIPLAVLAGIVFKVGLDIVDWGFLKRAHKISSKGALITYSVIFLTVFVDLIVAVGVGVFVADTLTIDRLSKLRSKGVKTITDADDEIDLSDQERRLLDQAKGRVLIFQLSGPMIFGVAKAISREHQALENCDVLILDLTNVPHLGVTSSLALENALQEAAEKNRTIFLVGAKEQSRSRLNRLEVLSLIPENRRLQSRTEALEIAVGLVNV
ncbi:Bicarbonate transporter BicA [Acaryochloris thomasi RCC1774]|uniref:Bicarbonate transporter BicA n=1 Tax=Acaryochloris thomasi RCC1774 TaxID=1764569 RepID=A0A2W1JR73_9CYAN|nr:SulP family inorganic anion transporter [Acaryochloris thomasi]PZD72574.1 Bicarbonate transporter BicA [Acaryochloris thomasi RCC1774]